METNELTLQLLQEHARRKEFKMATQRLAGRGAAQRLKHALGDGFELKQALSQLDLPRGPMANLASISPHHYSDSDSLKFQQFAHHRKKERANVVIRQVADADEHFSRVLGAKKVTVGDKDASDRAVDEHFEKALSCKWTSQTAKKSPEGHTSRLTAYKPKKCWLDQYGDSSQDSGVTEALNRVNLKQSFSPSLASSSPSTTSPSLDDKSSTEAGRGTTPTSGFFTGSTISLDSINGSSKPLDAVHERTPESEDPASKNRKESAGAGENGPAMKRSHSSASLSSHSSPNLEPRKTQPRQSESANSTRDPRRSVPRMAVRKTLSKSTKTPRIVLEPNSQAPVVKRETTDSDS